MEEAIDHQTNQPHIVRLTDASGDIKPSHFIGVVVKQKTKRNGRDYGQTYCACVH